MKQRKIELNVNANNNIFDPDELKLNKKMISGWVAHIRKNAESKNLKSFCFATETILKVTPEEQIISFWSEILKKINELLMMNALEVAKGNNEKWAETVEKLFNKDKEVDEVE